MAISNLNFGTSFKTEPSSTILLSQQKQNFLDGLILAKNKISQNRIQDELFFNIERQANDAKSDTITLSYKSQTGEASNTPIRAKIKDLSGRTKKIEQFFLDSLRKLQPPDVRVKTVYVITSKEQDEGVLKQAKANYIAGKND